MLNNSLHILLVEDSPTHAELIRDSLLAWRPKMRLTTVDTLAAAREALARVIPDIALIDLMLPDGRGTELLPADREGAVFPSVLLTGSGDEQSAVAAMKAGALDYLVKTPTILAEMPRIVERSLREWGYILRHRQAEAALRESEERFRSTFEQAAVGMAHVSPEGDWLWFNRQACAILGYSAEELRRLKVEELSLPEEFAVERRQVRRLLKGELSALNMEKRYRRKDGTLIWVDLNVSVVRGDDGRVRYLIGVIQDISGRKQVEAEREQLTAELEATINAIADAVVIYECSGTIRHMNPAAERMLGYGAEDRDKPLAERIRRFRVETPEGFPFPVEETMERVFAGRSMRGVLAVLCREDGSKVWMSNSAAPILTREGEMVGAVGTSTDITALHELQLEREAFLHTISHDLRAPLTIIQGYSQLLQELLSGEEGTEETRSVCGEVLDGVRKMARMTDDLVDLARLEGGTLQLQKTPLLLQEFVPALVDRAGRVLPAERLRLEIPPTLPAVTADPDRLERILLNLLSNALKYSPVEAPVHLQATRAADGIRVSIIDAGSGIRAEDLPHLFARFFRSAGSTHANSVGLGLYITRTLVEAHGGSIHAESTPGEGSTFFFTLPLS